MPTGKSAWIGVLIINPDIHTYLFSELYRMFIKREPFISQIFCNHTRTGMNEKTSETGLFQLAHRTLYFGLGHFTIPDCQRGTSKIGRRILKILFYSGKRILGLHAGILTTNQAE